MSRPATGKPTTSLIWVKQSDGSYYCYERTRIWKDGKDVSTKKLLGKADVKGGELRPTRQKRTAAEKNESAAKKTPARRGRKPKSNAPVQNESEQILEPPVQNDPELNLEASVQNEAEPTPEVPVQNEAEPAPETPVEDELESSLEEAIQDEFESTLEEAVQDELKSTLEEAVQDELESTLEAAIQDVLESTSEDEVPDDAEFTLEEEVQADTEPTLEETAQDDDEPTSEETVQGDDEPTLEEAIQDVLEPTSEETVQGDDEPTLEEAIQDVLEPTSEETLQDDAESTVEEAIQDMLEPSLEETIEDEFEATLEEAVQDEAEPIPEASEKHPGMMDILDYIGKVSGIDEDLLASADAETAQKIISLARYIVGTGGASVPEIEEWTLTHPLPYSLPMTEEVCLDLVKKIGANGSIRQNFFRSRLYREEDLEPVIAYDSSSEKNPDSCNGQSIKPLCLYSLKTGRPLLFTTTANGFAPYSAAGVKEVITVTDGGCVSEDTLAALLQTQDYTLTTVKPKWSWVKAELENHVKDLSSAPTVMKADTDIRGITVPLTKDLKFKNVRNNSKKKASAEDDASFQRQIYLHVYYDTVQRDRENKAFMDELQDIRKLIENGTALDEQARKKADKYLKVKKDKKHRTVKLNDKAIDQACRYNGLFAYISDCYKDADTALAFYRKKEWLENYFERLRQNAVDDPTLAGNPDGWLFVQFIALCYIEELQARISELASKLGVTNGDPSHDTDENLYMETVLKTWLRKRSVSRILKWFDAAENAAVSSEIRDSLWNTETAARDRLFLQLLEEED